MQPPKPLPERLKDNLATLWQLWHHRRHSAEPSAELIQLANEAYGRHKILIKQMRRVNKMNIPRLPKMKSVKVSAAVKNIRKSKHTHKNLAA